MRCARPGRICGRSSRQASNYPSTTPEPDIFLTSEPDGEGLYPGGSVALVVEVADTTLAGDLGVKAAIYARGGVPEYWVADVNGRVIHQMWKPVGDGYVERSERTFGGSIDPITISGLSIATSVL